MTQEDKKLLFQDLCARLPYRVKVKTPYNDAVIIGTTVRKEYNKDEWYIDVITDKQTYPIKCIKPYLRPMSSMTEEEIWKYKCLNDALDENYEVHIDNAYPAFDWLNSHHFDYRGLIPKCLAIEVTKENNPYNE